MISEPAEKGLAGARNTKPSDRAGSDLHYGSWKPGTRSHHTTAEADCNAAVSARAASLFFCRAFQQASHDDLAAVVGRFFREIEEEASILV